MEIIISVRENDPRRVSCPLCNNPMRLVGLEPHFGLPDLVELATYDCECGEILAIPQLSVAVVAPPVEAS